MRKFMPWVLLVTKSMVLFDFIEEEEMTLLKSRNWPWLEKNNLKKDSFELKTKCCTSRSFVLGRVFHSLITIFDL